ncbi:MAG: NapC/NirT family cytochrome c [Bacillota bacterium]|nr:NapC/NirT family cytochrome c [Bacillota bacterium]
MEKLKGSNKWFIISIILGVFILFYAGTGFAMKATDRADFCGSCHVMNEAVRTYNLSVHADLACNQCHAPHQITSKIGFKTQAGFKDIYKNVTNDVGDVIQATSKTKEIANQNCINCHSMTNKNVAMDAKEFCTDCHRQVPHFNKIPIGERMVAGE